MSKISTPEPKNNHKQVYQHRKIVKWNYHSVSIYTDWMIIIYITLFFACLQKSEVFKNCKFYHDFSQIGEASPQELVGAPTEVS